MKKMVIFDPAMCCSTGVCGPSVDKNLIRVSTLINNLKNKGIIIERYNLATSPQVYLDNKIVNEMLNKYGVDILPITMVDGEVVKTKTYPTNEEFSRFLGIPEDYTKVTIKKPSKGCCGDGCC